MGIQNEIIIPVSADHSSICKFESSSNPVYKQIKSLIAEFVKEGPPIVEKRRELSPQASEKNRQ